MSSRPKQKIWIDLDNTPHVPLFEPILAELRARGFSVLVTARDAFQVCELADKKEIPYIKVGRHYGKNSMLKLGGLLWRALQLGPLVLRERPALAVSHGARSQIILSKCLRIPTVLMEDYEYSLFPGIMRPTWVLAPEAIPSHLLPCKSGNVRRYAGIKEDVYAWKLRPDPSILATLGVSDSEVLATVRPPATEAHYHNPESEKLFERFMNRACSIPGLRVILLPRNNKQGRLIRARWPVWFQGQKTIIPDAVLDGLNLLWHSDLVVSGGGTMNREAAALGIPVYSIFRGTIGAVDRQLCAEGRLVLIDSLEGVDRLVRLTRRSRKSVEDVTSRRVLNQVVDSIQELAQTGLSS